MICIFSFNFIDKLALAYFGLKVLKNTGIQEHKRKLNDEEWDELVERMCESPVMRRELKKNNGDLFISMTSLNLLHASPEEFEEILGVDYPNFWDD